MKEVIKKFKFWFNNGYVVIKAYTADDAIEILKHQQPQITASVYEEI